MDAMILYEQISDEKKIFEFFMRLHNICALTEYSPKNLEIEEWRELTFEIPKLKGNKDPSLIKKRPFIEGWIQEKRNQFIEFYREQLEMLNLQADS